MMKRKRELPYQILVDKNNIDIDQWPLHLRKIYLHVEELIELQEDAIEADKKAIQSFIENEADELMDLLEIHYRGRLQYDCDEEEGVCEPILKPKVPLPDKKNRESKAATSDQAILKELHSGGRTEISYPQLQAKGFKSKLNGRVTQVGGYVLLKPAFKDGLYLFTEKEYRSQ